MAHCAWQDCLVLVHHHEAATYGVCPGGCTLVEFAGVCPGGVCVCILDVAAVCVASSSNSWTSLWD